MITADDVAEAIEELEGASDLMSRDLLSFHSLDFSGLAAAALNRATLDCADLSRYANSFSKAYPHLLLEAAAILRDGWRPSRDAHGHRS